MARDWYHLGRVQTLDQIRARLDELTVESVLEHVRSHPPQDYTIDHHAEGGDLPHIALEIRQDLIANAEGQARIAEVLHGIIGSIPQSLGIRLQA